MENKAFNFGLKALSETGTFDGDIAVYSNVDYANEILMPQSCAKTVTESGGVIPLFLNHASGDIRQKVGVLQLTDSPRALRAHGLLNMDLPVAREALSIMKFDKLHNLKTSLSIGYQVLKSDVKNGVRYLSEIRLFEASIVGLGCNPEAVVTGVKKATAEPRIYGRKGDLTLEEHEFVQWFESLLKGKP